MTAKLPQRERSTPKNLATANDIARLLRVGWRVRSQRPSPIHPGLTLVELHRTEGKGQKLTFRHLAEGDVNGPA